MSLTREQLQDILAHDGPTDIWVLNEDGSIAVLPDQDITELQDPATWPRYLVRSGSVDNIVIGMGWENAVPFINDLIDRIILAKPSPKALAMQLIAALKALKES